MFVVKNLPKGDIESNNREGAAAIQELWFIDHMVKQGKMRFNPVMHVDRESPEFKEFSEKHPIVEKP